MPAKRCPMCHRASESTAWQCSCGYEFGQDLEKVRGMLRSQLHNAWITSILYLLLDLAMLPMLLFVPLIVPLGAFIVLTTATARSVRKILISRESLRQLAPKDLPTARLLT
ncbi:MAG: hypothetical protein JO257_04410 [Deltaproteobacteria bacterium]|nr:hypothetical protein [Deltaproteobacteria bacterium]